MLPSLFEYYLNVLTLSRQASARESQQRLTVLISGEVLGDVRTVRLLSGIFDLLIDFCDLEHSFVETFFLRFVQAASAVVLAQPLEIPPSNASQEVAYAISVLKRNASLVLANIAELCPKSRTNILSVLQARQSKLVDAIFDASEISVQRSLLRLTHWVYTHETRDGINKFKQDVGHFFDSLGDGQDSVEEQPSRVFQRISLKSNQASEQIEHFRHWLILRAKMKGIPCSPCVAMETCHVFLSERDDKLYRDHAPATIDWNVHGLAVRAAEYLSGHPLHIPYYKLRACNVSHEHREFEATVVDEPFSHIVLYMSSEDSRQLFQSHIIPRLFHDANVKVIPLKEPGKRTEALLNRQNKQLRASRKSSVSRFIDERASDGISESPHSEAPDPRHKNQSPNEADVTSAKQSGQKKDVVEPDLRDNALKRLEHSVFAGLDGDDILLPRRYVEKPFDHTGLDSKSSSCAKGSIENATSERSKQNDQPRKFSGTPRRLVFDSPGPKDSPNLDRSREVQGSESGAAPGFNCKLVTFRSPQERSVLSVARQISPTEMLCLAPSKETVDKKQSTGRLFDAAQSRNAFRLRDDSATEPSVVYKDGDVYDTQGNVNRTKGVHENMKEESTSPKTTPVHHGPNREMFEVLCANSDKNVPKIGEQDQDESVVLSPARNIWDVARADVDELLWGDAEVVLSKETDVGQDAVWRNRTLSRKIGRPVQTTLVRSRRDVPRLPSQTLSRKRRQHNTCSYTDCLEWKSGIQSSADSEIDIFGREAEASDPTPREVTACSKGSSGDDESNFEQASMLASLSKVDKLIFPQATVNESSDDAVSLAKVLKIVRSLLNDRRRGSIAIRQRTQAVVQSIDCKRRHQNRTDTERMNTQIAKLKCAHRKRVCMMRGELKTRLDIYSEILRKVQCVTTSTGLSTLRRRAADTPRRAEKSHNSLKLELSERLQQEYQRAKSQRTKQTKTDTLMTGISSLLGNVI